MVAFTRLNADLMAEPVDCHVAIPVNIVPQVPEEAALEAFGISMNNRLSPVVSARAAGQHQQAGFLMFLRAAPLASWPLSCWPATLAAGSPPRVSGCFKRSP